MLEKGRKHEIRCMEDSFAYAKGKWDKSHTTPDFKVGCLELVSTTSLNIIKGCKNLKASFSGPFVIKSLHGENEIEVELSEELSNKHPTFPVRLVNPYRSSDAEKFPLRNRVLLHIPPIESFDTKKITKVLRETNLRTKKLREYLDRYSDPTCDSKWLAEKEILAAIKFLIGFRHTRNNNIKK
ncbi:hypothetical protein O181_117238 [Austropuccinia psidii MF-1]|uniref:Uncharacterized protein n=1 Tax=Austropuccinia psidii MF-1 TaxID=1389203 RepID=A0A9Q3K9X3_9BASI|nr:hypothetical protein [Austropuccinia psidii MF-1]